MIVIRIYGFSNDESRLLEELRKSLQERVESIEGIDTKGGVLVFFSSESSVEGLGQGIAVYLDGFYWGGGLKDKLAGIISEVVQKFFPKSFIQTSVKRAGSEEVFHFYDPRKFYKDNL